MKQVGIGLIVVSLLALGGAQAYGECTCATAKVDRGWCSDCKVGYFAGATLKHQELFDTLAGHRIDLRALSCSGCKAALRSDGICTECKVAYARSKAYDSWVGHRLAKGKVKDVKEITCPSCSTNAEKSGWCDSCKVGMVGNLAFKDKEAFGQAVKAREVLATAANTKCKTCALALVTDGKCAKCKVAYKNGKKRALATP